MASLQLNADLFRDLSIIAEDEVLSARLMRYIKRLIATKKTDPALMTEEELLDKIERGEQAYQRGECHELLANEDVTAYLKRRGYDL